MTTSHISIFFNSDLMLWQSPDIIQTNLMLLSFSFFYFLVFCCTNYVCIIFLAKLHFTNLFGLLTSVPPKIPNNCFYRYLYLKIVLENMIAVYIIYISLEYNSQSLENLQALTALKHHQQYSTLPCPYYVNQTSKKSYYFGKADVKPPINKRNKLSLLPPVTMLRRNGSPAERDAIMVSGSQKSLEQKNDVTVVIFVIH